MGEALFQCNLGARAVVEGLVHEVGQCQAARTFGQLLEPAHRRRLLRGRLALAAALAAISSHVVYSLVLPGMGFRAKRKWLRMYVSVSEYVCECVYVCM